MFISSCSLVAVRQTKVVRIGTKLLVPALSDQKIVFQSKTSATRPINTWLDCENHALLHRASTGLVRVGRLVGASTHAVADRVRRLPGVAALRDASADQSIQLRKTRPVVREHYGFAEHTQQEV